MTLPRWLIDKRFRVCQSCSQREGCKATGSLFDDVPLCPIAAHPSASDELRWERAWPQHADAVSGCCDSALHGPL